MEWQGALEKKGFKVNVKKTEVMVCTRVETSDKKKDRLKEVETIKYLGSMTSENGGCEEEVRHRLGAV